MITLLASLLGFLASAFPDILKLFKGSQDNRQELAIMDKQIEFQKAGFQEKMQEIGAQADIAEMIALHQPQVLTGIRWIDGLKASVTPIITYWFFADYTFIKIFTIVHYGLSVVSENVWLIWDDTDKIIFATVISFWFGKRAMTNAQSKQ